MMNIAMKNPQSIDKTQVALRFAQAGQSYPEHAVVQRKIALQLFDLIRQYCPKQLNQVFEMGCGSGNLSHLLIENFQIKHLIFNDLYSEVQQHFQSNQIQAVQTQPKIEFLIGDIEQLNFPQNNDLIASSSVLQWMGDLDAVFAKARHSLNPHVLLCFSTFGPQNLQEIKALTGQGLDYLSLENIQEKLLKNGFEILHISEQIEAINFEHPKKILQHLKATGVTATASNFRWTKQSLQDFYLNYQQFLTQDESGEAFYSLSYHPIYCIARRMP
jgi:malonyl-CoA O-methyltransferase